MPASNRPFPSRTLLAAGLFFVLAGCGIKSGLEQPQRAARAEAGVETSATAKKETAELPKRTTDQEFSRVQGGRAFNLLPPETPLEWEKEKKEKKKGSTLGKAGGKSTAPEKPFILDSLL